MFDYGIGVHFLELLLGRQTGNYIGYWCGLYGLEMPEDWAGNPVTSCEAMDA